MQFLLRKIVEQTFIFLRKPIGKFISILRIPFGTLTRRYETSQPKLIHQIQPDWHFCSSTKPLFGRKLITFERRLVEMSILGFLEGQSEREREKEREVERYSRTEFLKSPVISRLSCLVEVFLSNTTSDEESV